ncbi:MAG: MFS transporter [Nodosilinea sp.]
MRLFFQRCIQRWLPDLDPRVWILAAGRLLSQVGIGFTLFYAPIFFVNQVGLSATQVGLGIGIGSVAGMAGRFLGGSMADSPRWGRRPTLLGSTLVSALADGVLLLAQGFPLFLAGNLLMGFGVGLYWPATEAVAADLTVGDQRNEAYAVVRLADSLGLGVGVVLGGLLISLTGAYRALFVVDGITFLLFFAIVYVAIAETRPAGNTEKSFFHGWDQALRDTNLMVFALANVGFTAYLAQVQSTLPVYLNRFVPTASGQGISERTLSLLFTAHVVLAALTQLPMARWLKRFRPVQGLMISALFWGLGFCLVGVARVAPGAYLWAGAALGMMALGMVAYTPIASALVVAMAPDALRGVYLSVNSMCWAVGYLVGPPLGGWALDQGTVMAQGFWLVLAITVVPALGVLAWLDRRLRDMV